MRQSRRAINGFTLIELQVAALLLVLATATFAALIKTEATLLRRTQAEFKPNATLYLTPSLDPLARQLGAPARISAAPFSQSLPTIIIPTNVVTVLSVQNDLATESITVTVDAEPIK